MVKNSRSNWVCLLLFAIVFLCIGISFEGELNCKPMVLEGYEEREREGVVVK